MRFRKHLKTALLQPKEHLLFVLGRTRSSLDQQETLVRYEIDRAGHGRLNERLRTRYSVALVDNLFECSNLVVAALRPPLLTRLQKEPT